MLARPRTFVAVAAVAAAATDCDLGQAQKKYDPGASDTEIKIGNIMPYSGPASSYGMIGKARGGLFQQDQRRGRHQRPQDQFHQL